MTPIESINIHLAELSEDLARSVEAQTEQAKFAEGTQDAMRDIQQKVGALSDEVGALSSLVQQFIRETQALRAESQKLNSEVRKVVGG